MNKKEKNSTEISKENRQTLDRLKDALMKYSENIDLNQITSKSIFLKRINENVCKLFRKDPTIKRLTNKVIHFSYFPNASLVAVQTPVLFSDGELVVLDWHVIAN